MKHLNHSGWAAILAVTMLLVSCAPYVTQDSSSASTTGLAATMTQLTEQNIATHEREALLDRRENALAIDRAWIRERERQLDQREAELERRESTVKADQAWLEARERQLMYEETAASPLLLADDVLLPAKIEQGECYARTIVPAEYLTVTEKVLVKSTDDHPDRYQTVTKQVKVGDERMAWQEVLCESTLTRDKVSEIQVALLGAGYDPGAVDGELGPQTIAALNAFQRSQKLPVANAPTIETIKALGVSR